MENNQFPHEPAERPSTNEAEQLQGQSLNNSPTSSKPDPKLLIPLVIAVAIIIGGSFWYYQKKMTELPKLDGCDIYIDGKPACDNEDLTSETAGWQTYRNEEYGFEVKYPEELSLTENPNVVALSHSVIFRHNDPCDLRDGSSMADKLTDFNASFEVFNNDIQQVVKTKLPYLATDIIENGKFKLNPGNIDLVKFGDLIGHKHTMGVEGCGLETYFFEGEQNRVLVVQHSFSPERTPLVTNYKEYLAIPGIITSDQETNIFNQILSTFKFIDKLSEREIINQIENNWFSLQKNITARPKEGINNWPTIDAFQFLGKNFILAIFEDGHIVGAMIVKGDSGNFSYIDSFFDADEWKEWMSKYPNLNYNSYNYVKSVVRDRKIITFDQWTQDETNREVNWLYKQ